MRKGFITSLLTLASVAAFAAPFTPGNLVVSQVGADNAAGAPGSAGNRIILKEYTPSGTLVQAITLPFTGAGNKIVTSGTGTSVGFLTLNDGVFALIGYNAEEGTAGVATSAAATTTRTVALVGVDGSVDVSTSVNDAFDVNTARTAVANGNNIYIAGTASGAAVGTAGVRMATKGSSTSVEIMPTPANMRNVDIYNGQLYVSSSTTLVSVFKGVSAVGTGLPTTGGQTLSLLNCFPDASVGASDNPHYDFVFADANTLYVADDRTVANGGGVRKYTLSGSTWTFQYLLSTGLANGVRGLTIDKSGATPVLYGTTASTGTALFTVADTGAFSSWSEIVRSDAAASANARMRGIRLVKAAGGSTTVSGKLNLNGYTGPNAIGNMTFTLVPSAGSNEVKTVAVDDAGNYSFTTSLSGTVDILIEGSTALGKLVSGVNLSGAVTLNANLANGDADDSNSCDLLDYFALSDSYNLALGDAGYNDNADFNGDDSVDLLDYFVLSDNYNLEGDAL
jgi:hypothetical protein